MAYAKKASRRYRRSRRLGAILGGGPLYPRRSGKRFPRNTEVKSVSKAFNKSFDIAKYGETDNITYFPGFVSYIGDSLASRSYSINISTGTGQGEKIGCKIEPIKLRISGAISLDF